MSHQLTLSERLRQARKAISQAVVDAERFTMLARYGDPSRRLIYTDLARAAGDSVETWTAILAELRPPMPSKTFRPAAAA